MPDPQQDPASYGPILTAAQVGQLLSMNVASVRALAADGTLPASRIPGTRKWLFKLEEILAFLDEHNNQPAQAPDASGPEQPIARRK